MNTTNNWTIDEQHEFDARMALRWCGEGLINVEEEEEDRINDDQCAATDSWTESFEEIPF